MELPFVDGASDPSILNLTAASFRRPPGLGLGGFGSCYSLLGCAPGYRTESSRSICALSAICLCSCCLSRDCLPLVDHLRLAFESRFVYNKARYVFVSRRPHLQNLPPPPPVFLQIRQSDSRHQAHREYRHQARSFLTALLFTPERRIKPHFPHKHLWIYRVLFSHRTT